MIMGNFRDIKSDLLFIFEIKLLIARNIARNDKKIKYFLIETLSNEILLNF